MTKDEYRQHMRSYSRDTMVMSFTVTKHPDYQALRASGEETIPWLLEDMLDKNWYCGSCQGIGMESVPTWREEWEKDAAWPPRRTGNVCPECGGRGHISSWACMTLLGEKAGDDHPVVEEWMRGRHLPLTNLWRRWGEQRGYLPPTPDGKPSTFLGRVLGLFKWWGRNDAY